MKQATLYHSLLCMPSFQYDTPFIKLILYFSTLWAYLRKIRSAIFYFLKNG